MCGLVVGGRAGLVESDPMAVEGLKTVALNPASVVKKTVAPQLNRTLEKIASVEFYKKNKNRIFKSLCSRGDLAPRVLRAGHGNPLTMCKNVRAGLQLFAEAKREARVVRGWKLFVVVSTGTISDGSWRAVPHSVILDVGTGKMHCFTAEPGGSDYIFLASSRMAASLTDEEFLVGDRVYKSVIGGNSLYVQMACNAFPTALARSPELALPYPMSRALVPSGVMLWIRMNVQAGVDPVQAAFDIGFPSLAADAEDAFAESELVVLCKATLDDAARRRLSVEDALETLTPILGPLLAGVSRDLEPRRPLVASGGFG